jgi:hypothetical protein
MTYAIGQPVRLTKSLSVQAESGVALPPGASGTVIDVGDKEIVVRFPCLAEREGAVTFDADCATDYMETDCTSCIYFAPNDHCCLDPQRRGRAGA